MYRIILFKSSGAKFEISRKIDGYVQHLFNIAPLSGRSSRHLSAPFVPSTDHTWHARAVQTWAPSTPPRTSHVDAARRPVVPLHAPPSQLCFRVRQSLAKSVVISTVPRAVAFFFSARKSYFPSKLVRKVTLNNIPIL